VATLFSVNQELQIVLLQELAAQLVTPATLFCRAGLATLIVHPNIVDIDANLRRVPVSSPLLPA